MGLLKKKDILLAGQFAHHDDPFYADNQVLKTTSKNQLPSSGADLMVAKSQAVFFTVDNILNKLLANDKFISQYLDKIRASSIGCDRAAEAFSQQYAAPETQYFEDQYRKHFEEHHNARASDMVQLSTVYGSYMHNDFSNFNVAGAKAHFTKQSYDAIGTTFKMSSDVLISCEFDDSSNIKYPTNYVNVQVMNEHTGNAFSYTMSKGSSSEIASQIPPTSESKYIYKQWLSGLKELLIYIPSTFTFYNEELSQPGHDPHSKTTWIKVVINKRHFKLSHVYSMQICGQSLPLQIHSSKVPFFADCPQPSIVRTMCISDQLSSNVDCVYDDNTSMFTLLFCCYGTDAQAIQLFCD